MPNVVVKDAVVFITGTNRERGIGRALVEEAAKRGAKKIYATARDAAQLHNLLSKYPDKIIPLNLDVTNKDEVAHAAIKAHDVQILINNAGVSGYSGLCFNYNEEAARQEFEVNYWGPLNLIRAFYKTLINNKNCAIANVISIAGLAAFPLCGSYSASKAAAHSLTQSVRAELARYGVPVLGVYPGPIDTDMADGISISKESPANAAIRIFDGIEQGVEDIVTDAFGEDFVNHLRSDYKAVEKNNADFVHQMEER